MNSKIIIPIAVLAVIIPAVAIFAYSETGQNAIQAQQISDKMFQMSSVDEIAYTLDERTDVSDLVITGKVLNVTPKLQQIDPEHKAPWLFSIATVKIDEVLKGEIKSQVVRVQMFGGETEDRLTVAERHDIKKDDKVLMFLVLDPESIFGNNYGIVGESSGMFIIEDDEAKMHEEERTIPAGELKSAIKNFSGLN